MTTTAFRLGRVLLERQRAECCRVLAAVPPEAPTLCEGWRARDLAAHLDALCRDPLSWPGMAIPALRPGTRRRSAALVARLGYAGLVRRLRTRSPWMPLFGVDPIQGWRHHLGEWYVHTEDVRRANAQPSAAHDPDLAEALWQRVLAAAPIVRRHDPRGLILRHTDGRAATVLRRPDPVSITGEPGELMVHVYRGRAAQVAVKG
ncbi:MAG: maleylpyruvate isomerase family mycothiol-dependent enzyme [Micropruina sp.]|nr:maleylpyruvate isomerase family mycothiol-dependent enzyme [Micropruina sp.]